MKKIVVTLMCALLATSLVACQKQTPDELNPNLNTGNTSTSDNVSDGMPGDGIDDVTGDSASIVEIGVAETVLLDTDEYKITLDDTAAKYGKDDKYNHAITFSTTAENFTDQKVAFCFTNVKINGEKIQDTEASALRQIYGTEVDANDHGYPGIFIPYQSLYVADVTTVETISFVIEVYPVTGSYGEHGELLYSSEEVIIETIEGYEGADFDDDDNEEEEDIANSYFFNEVTIEEQVLIDDPAMKICTTGEFEFEEGYAHKIGLTFENKTDSEWMIQSEYIAVNGYSLSTPLWITVPANGTLETTLDILYYDMMLANIDTISTIEFVLSVGILDKYTYDPIIIETSAAGYEQPNDFEGTTVYNENGIEIIALDCVYDVTYLSGPVLYIHNENGSGIDIMMQNVTINGVPSNSENIHNLHNNQHHVRILDCRSTLNENDIETITEVAFDMTISDDSFNTIVQDVPITISY